MWSPGKKKKEKKISTGERLWSGGGGGEDLQARRVRVCGESSQRDVLLPRSLAGDWRLRLLQTSASSDQHGLAAKSFDSDNKSNFVSNSRDIFFTLRCSWMNIVVCKRKYKVVTVWWSEEINLRLGFFFLFGYPVCRGRDRLWCLTSYKRALSLPALVASGSRFLLALLVPGLKGRLASLSYYLLYRLAL